MITAACNDSEGWVFLGQTEEANCFVGRMNKVDDVLCQIVGRLNNLIHKLCEGATPFASSSSSSSSSSLCPLNCADTIPDLEAFISLVTPAMNSSIATTEEAACELYKKLVDVEKHFITACPSSSSSLSVSSSSSSSSSTSPSNSSSSSQASSSSHAPSSSSSSSSSAPSSSSSSTDCCYYSVSVHTDCTELGLDDTILYSHRENHTGRGPCHFRDYPVSPSVSSSSHVGSSSVSSSSSSSGIGRPYLYYVNSSQEWRLEMGGMTGVVARFVSINHCNPQGVYPIEIGPCAGQTITIN